MPDPPHSEGASEPDSLTRDNTKLVSGLYLVASPIGNLEDITLRAIRVLHNVDRIACEDTRQTQKLLNHYGIKVPTISCHEHNELSRAAELVEDLKGGARIALVSDAGMPAISDPGVGLVQAAIDAGIAVIPVPGPNAALSALIASGLSTQEFAFLGFLPEKSGARRSRLEELVTEAHSAPRRTLIFYEAPHRIAATLADLETVWGPELRIVIARELTKLHEEFLRGTVADVRRDLTARDRIRGEITLLVQPPLHPRESAAAAPAARLTDRLARLQAEAGIDEKEALKRLARESGQSKSEVYRELQRQRARLK